MRRGHDGCIFKRDDDIPFAINLGADCCAEHEWGIGQLRRLLGCSDNVDGLKRYTISPTFNAAKYLGTRTIKGIFYLIVGENVSFSRDDTGVFTPRTHELYIGTDSKWSAAWCDTEFGIAVSKKGDPETFVFVKNLAEHIKVGNAAIWFGGKNAHNPFGRAGLVVGIPSLTPKEIDEAMVKAHVDARALNVADEATGIKKLLTEKGKQFYACSPRWADSDKGRTKHSVIYWLNSNGPFGWYTVEELTDWANGVPGNVPDANFAADEESRRKHREKESV